MKIIKMDKPSVLIQQTGEIDLNRDYTNSNSNAIMSPNQPLGVQA